jgi:SpoIID/LytB domain protein
MQALSKDSDLNDELSLLYSSQVHFGAQGVPLVTIGLMEEQDFVEVSAPGGLVLTGRMLSGPNWKKKTIRIPKNTRARFVVDVARSAKVLYWCAVERVTFSEKELLKRVLKTWRDRSFHVQVFEVGSVFGVQGQVIDNRTYILGVRAFQTEKEAEEFGQAVFSQYGSPSFVHAHLKERPSGNIAFQGGNRKNTVLDLVSIRSVDGGPIRVHRVEFAKGYRWHGFSDREYMGTVLITIDRKKKLVVVNRVPVDRLLRGLVPAEIYPHAPMEALKAQAVVARGEIFAKIGTRHFLDPYLLCAHTHCQVYSGVSFENNRTNKAVRVTRGELLFLQTKLVDTVYCACCGGHTENNDVVWSHPRSQALRGKPDMDAAGRKQWMNVGERMDEWLEQVPPAYCMLSSFRRPNLFRWTKTISSAQMDAWIGKEKQIGHVVAIQVMGRGISGRVKAVRVVGTDGVLIVQREWPIRQLFGLLKSGAFTVEALLDEEQLVTGFQFRGAGWGHGVGLCQLGAIGMAETGHDYMEILSHYYNGATIFRTYGGPLGEKKPKEMKFVDLQF